jgi:hypothetical protein
MQRLSIPATLKEEFATVETLWHSTAKTKFVDALILSWTKYEKQLRRLFCYLLFQHPEIKEANINEVVASLAQNRDLYPHTFIIGIEQLGVASVPALLASRHAELSQEVARIQKYRNKLIHGQITGLGIKSAQLQRDILWIVDWVSCLATAAENEFGYDGLRRNTYRTAKATSKIAASKYPFKKPADLKQWLSKLANSKEKCMSQGSEHSESRKEAIRKRTTPARKRQVARSD